jgi:hypothetical protein
MGGLRSLLMLQKEQTGVEIKVLDRDGWSARVGWR